MSECEFWVAVAERTGVALLVIIAITVLTALFAEATIEWLENRKSGTK